AWIGSRMRQTASILGIVVTAMATLSLTGYLFHAEKLFSSARFTGIAMQTASALMVLGIGMIAAVPERQPVRALLQKSAAGMLARRALPIVVILPIALGWLRVWGQRAG